MKKLKIVLSVNSEKNGPSYAFINGGSFWLAKINTKMLQEIDTRNDIVEISLIFLLLNPAQIVTNTIGNRDPPHHIIGTDFMAGSCGIMSCL